MSGQSRTSAAGLLPDASMGRPYQPPLDQVLRTLGSQVLSAAHLPGPELTVGEPVVHDPDDGLDERPGCVLLAVGARAGAPATAELVRQAAAHGYHAVVLKDRGAELGPLAEAARQAGVALLIAPEHIPWRELDALLTAAVTGPGADTAYSSIPMGDLSALADAVAATIGGATCVEDASGNVLGYSTIPGQEIDEIRKLGILGRKTPRRPTNRTEYSRVFRAGGPVRFASLYPGHSPRLAVAVRAGARLLGFIWVLDGAPPVVPGAMRLLEDAARIAALHLLHARNPGDAEGRHRSETLRALLEGTTPEESVISESAAAARLGLPPDTYAAILVLAPASDMPEPGTALAGVLDLVGICCGTWDSGAVCTTSGGRLYALLPVPPGTRPAELVRVATEATTAVAKSTRLRLHAGIGPVVRGLHAAARSSVPAERVVRVLAETAGGEPAVATEEQVRSRVVLLDLMERGGAGQLLEPVRRMLDYDAAHATAHAASLLAYLDAFGEAAKAAAALTVHENTLRYRVRRVQSLFDLDLADPAERLVVWLQLRLLDLRGEL